MKTHNLIQGSKEWHEHRAAHLNASDAPAMMGLSRLKKRDELLREYKTYESKEFSGFVQNILDKGHEHEAMARPIAEGIIGEELYPVTGSSRINGCPLSASFDGTTLDESIIFEHKSINDEFRNITDVSQLHEMYKIQMDQQLLISGAEKCLFMASDGTEEDRIWFWYETTKKRTEAIVNGWMQFEADLETYILPETKPEAVANAIEQLPSLNIQIIGSVSQTNLTQYRESAMTYIGAINTNLQTDQDFADAESNIKFCKNSEDELKRAKQSAISSTVDIDELMKAVDYLSDQLRQKRLTLEKLVKSEKESIKRDIVEDANGIFASHVHALESELAGLTLPGAACSVDFYQAMKGKRTIESLNNAVNTSLAQAKIDADQAAKAMRDNLASFTSLSGGEYEYLFTDLSVIISKDKDDFILLVTTRIDQEKDRAEEAAENARLQKIKDDEAQAERDRIAAEQVKQDKADGVEAAPDPVTVDEKPTAQVVDLPERTEQPTEVSLSTSLKFWAHDNEISDQAVRSLIDILDSHGFEDLEFDDIA